MEIRTIIREGKEKTAIAVGHDDISIPKHLMSGEKHNGFILDGTSRSEWYWEGFCSIEGTRYIYFDSLDILTIDALSTELRDKALDIVRTIAHGLMESSPAFLDLTNGVFPLSRILLVRDGRVLLLPPDIGDIISLTQSEEENSRDRTDIIRGNAEIQFRLITEMAELLYFAASGLLPYADDAIRGSGYHPVPLRYIVTLDEKTDGFISFVLSAKVKEMRDIMGNIVGGKNLAWFLDKTTGLVWDLPARSTTVRDAAIAAAKGNQEYAAFIGNAEKKAKRNAFWRVKGTIIIISAIAGVALISFFGSWLYRLLQPPVTAGQDQVAVIEALYDAQNILDVELLTDAVKGCRLPQEMEITNLFVTSRARIAYEGFNPVINAEEWVEAGKPAIPETAIIYGVIVDSITQLDDDTFVADATWYTPYSADSTQETGGYVYEYHIQQTFDFEWNKRGWWNITGSEMTIKEELGRETVEYVPLNPATPTL